MELLLSNFPPAKFSNTKTQSVWEQNLKIAERVKIATGFVSSDSLVELKKVVELNEKPYIDLLIGMHFFEGFTKQQYDAALSLNEVLENRNLGAVYLSQTTKFHGKMYSFADKTKCFSAVIGSSNLSSLIGSTDRLYEVDCFFNDEKNISLIDKRIDDLFGKIGTKLSDIDPITKFKKHNGLLENHYGVLQIPPEEITQVWETKTSLQFDLLVKTEPKSNLNIYFGKGRDNKRGFVLPRGWYEAEIIVNKPILNRKGYPLGKRFKVYTDDGWSFDCETNGTDKKNFRSSEDLSIFGKWIKGRLEDSGALKIGTPVTDKVLNKYGNNIMKLTATNDPSVWLIEFKPKNG